MTVPFHLRDGAANRVRVGGTVKAMVITDTVSRLDDVRSRVSLAPIGEIDAGNLDALTDVLQDALLAGAHEIDLDLGAVTFMDTAAVELLQATQESLEAVDGFLCIRNATSSVRRLLSLTAFTPGRPAHHG